MADEILLKFAADVASYEKAIDNIEAKTLGLQKAADGVSKRVSNIGAAQNFTKLNSSLRQATTETAKLNKEVKKTEDESKKASSNATNGFLKLRNELKAVRGQMAELAATGKENTEEFKKLQLQAGQLQDTMKDLGTSIQLNAGDPLENLSSGFGSVRNSISSLDFDGVSRGLGAMATNIGRIDIKTFKEGLGGVVTNIGKIGGAILSSPILLLAGVVAGIVAALATWGESLEDIAERHNRNIETILENLERVNAGYERQSKLLTALGKDTFKVEDARIRANIRANKQAKEEAELSVKEQLEILTGLAKARSVLTGKTVEEQLEIEKRGSESYQEARKSLLEFDNNLENARTDLKVLFAEKATEADEKRNEEEKKRLEKSNENYKKYLEDRLQNGLKKFNEASDRERFNEQQQEKKDTEEANKKIDDILSEVYGKRVEKRRTLADELEIIRQEQLKAEEEATKKELELTLQRIEANRKEIQSKIDFANNIATIFESVATLTAENQEEAAERQKLFSAFGIGLNLATSLSNMIAGAAAAAAQTGALAPFTLVSYIAQGTALVLGAFAQIKQLLSAPVPKAAAQGEEFVQGKQYGKDTEHYMLAHGERVVTSGVNEKYWGELHAMHTGKYEKYIHENRILPALRKAMASKSDMESESFASNIANSLLLGQSWKGGNIVSILERIDKHETGRHQELVNVLKSRGRGSYRKK